MSNLNLNDYEERLRKAGIPTLGRLVWYAVSDILVEHNALVKLLVRHNFGAFLPRPPSDVDVFRRVCTSNQRRKVPGSLPDTFCNYLVRDVGYDDRSFFKRIVRETVDPQGRKLDYVEMCDLTFDRVNSVIDVVCKGSDPAADQVAQNIKMQYANERGRLNSYAVRELVRRILLEMEATNVRGPSGGVYFVGDEHAESVKSLEAMVRELSKTGNVTVHSLPLLDDEKQREMVRKAFESETVGEADDLLGEITDLLTDIQDNGRVVSTDKKTALLDKYHQMGKKVRSYSGLLQDSLDSANSRLEILKRQLMQLQAS